MSMGSISAKTIRGWYRVHKWTSLACTAFLLMSCVTGLPLIFHDELDSLLNHEVRPADLPASAPNASLDSMLVEAKTRMPGLEPYAIGFDDDEPRVFVTFTPTPRPEGFQTVIFDRHTGKLLETGTPGKDLLSRILMLHRELFMGLPGYLFMGSMALLFVISLLSGVLVYGPFMRRLDFGTYRSDEAVRVRWFDLHNLVGIVTFAWMFVVGTTGLMNALSAPLFALWRAQTLPALLAPYHGQPLPVRLSPVDTAVAHAAATLPSMEITSILFPNGVVSSPRHYVVWTRGKTPVTAKLFTPALIDAGTGEVTVAKGLPWYLRVLEISRPLHFGDYGGFALKILWAVFDVASIVVLVSGLALWVLRKSVFEQWLDRVGKLEGEGARA
jgi:uncharacterized iron-regulated membrane protein